MSRTTTPTVTSPTRGVAHRKAEEIYSTLRNRICLLYYPPGTKLSETRLAEEFSVSRTPIRRILQRLEFEHLAERRQGAHTIVTDFDLDSVIDIYEIRIILFENLDRLSPRERWWACSELLKKQRIKFIEIRSSRNIEKLGTLHIDLQETLSDVIQNRWAKDILMQLYFQISRIWLSLMPKMNWQCEVDYVISEINNLIEAVTHKDIRSVGMIRRNYISMNIQRMRTSMSDSRGN